jgi:archaellum component FlaG (FlaF/FlaG flagellin family)
MKILYFLLSVLFLVTSCSNEDTSKKEVVSSIVDEDQSEEDLKAQSEEEKILKEASENLTTMSFDKLEHNFGKIEEESENQTVFYVTNTGKKPLVIDNVSASCGCTTPTKPEQPIMPGKKDKIEVVFHPKPGQLNEQEKTVTVVANTDPKMVVLKIKAFVEPRDKN